MWKSLNYWKQALTFQTLPVTLRTTRFNIQKFYIVITWNLCVLYGSRKKQQILPYTTFLFLMPPHVHTNFRGPPSWLWWKFIQLLRLGRPWGAVTLSRWCEGWYIGRWGARRGLKSRSTNYPDHGHHGDPPPTRKVPMVEPGIEPGTSWLVVRSSDH